MSTQVEVVAVSSSSKITWKIDTFSALKGVEKTCYSDYFFVGSFKWKLWLRADGYLTLYLIPVDLRKPLFVQFSFVIRNQANSINNRVTKGTHEFLGNSNSIRGWQVFTPLSDFIDPAKGYIMNNTSVIEVTLTCRTDRSFSDDIHDLTMSDPNKVPVSEANKKPKLSAGQPFGEGRHYCIVGFGEVNEFEDVGGFSILKTQVPLYKQIWLKYGHIPSTNVMPVSSYTILVMVVKDLMTSIIDMHQCSYVELSSETVEGWEQMIKMAENFEFNIGWLRERFESVKKGVQKVKTELLEHGQPLRDAKSRVKVAGDELKMAEAQLIAAKQYLRENVSGLLSESDLEMYLVGDNLLLDGLF